MRPLPNLRITTLDVTDAAAVKSLLEQIPELHFLVNAAGIIRRDDEFDVDIFERVLT